MRNSSRELTFRVKGLKGCATEKLRERLPAMEQEDVSRGINDEGESEREREREPAKFRTDFHSHNYRRDCADSEGGRGERNLKALV